MGLRLERGGFITQKRRAEGEIFMTLVIICTNRDNRVYSTPSHRVFALYFADIQP